MNSRTPMLVRAFDCNYMKLTRCSYSMASLPSAHFKTNECFEGVSLSFDSNRIAHLKLASRPVNALTPTLLQNINKAIKSAEKYDNDAKGLILSSSLKVCYAFLLMYLLFNLIFLFRACFRPVCSLKILMLLI